MFHRLSEAVPMLLLIILLRVLHFLSVFWLNLTHQVGYLLGLGVFFDNFCAAKATMLE